MSECYLGEIRIWAGVKIPENWVLCNGQTISIGDNQALFSVIGTTYGGDGVSTFKLPNLQGMLPIGQGQGTGLTNRVIGQTAGVEAVTLTAATLPAHNHPLMGSTTAASTTTPSTKTVPGVPAGNFYAAYGTDKTKIFALNDVAVTPAGSGATAHENRMPATAINYIIATMGSYPQRP